MTNYRYAVIDEFGGVMRKFVSKTEAQPYLTAGTQLVPLPKQPQANPYEIACTILQDALF